MNNNATSPIKFLSPLTRSALYRVALPIVFAVLAGCAGRKAPQSEDALPKEIKTCLQQMSGARPMEQAALGRRIAKAVWPDYKRNVTNHGDHHWAVNHLVADLTGDGTPEHILVVWDESEYRGCVAIYGLLPDGTRVHHREVFDIWSYMPPEAIVLNNASACKYLLCRYDSIAHSSDVHETRFRILRWDGGKFRNILDLPEKYTSPFSTTRLQFKTCGDDLQVSVFFAFDDPMTRTNLITGCDSVWYAWDANSGAFNKSFSFATTYPGRLNSNRWDFLMRQGNANDDDFTKCWLEPRKPSPVDTQRSITPSASPQRTVHAPATPKPHSRAESKQKDNVKVRSRETTQDPADK